MAASTDEQTAPWFPVPDEPVISVEHPCIVKNSLKGIAMLGGSRAISQNLELGTERTLALSFTPDDPASRTVFSLHHQTNNVLLKISVPKRTGRKRKRGSGHPFVADNDNTAAASATAGGARQLVRSMSDNVSLYTVEPVGEIASTHVWRNMPDLVFSTNGFTFMQDIERTLLPRDYLRMKQFSLSRSYGPEEPDIVPVPVLSTQSLPYPYFYRQNQAIFKIPETNEPLKTNKLAAPKTYTYRWSFNDVGVPMEPMEGCPPLTDQPEQVQKIVKRMQPVFEKRPIWTRRALLNQLPKDTPFFFAKHSIAYVAFPIRSGPWRDTLCRFGVDPRSDPKYRKYQTVAIQIMHAQRGDPLDDMIEKPEKPWVNHRDLRSHIFEGSGTVPPDGKVWQLCDIEDEQLKSLVNIEELFIRPQCEIRYFGWYANGVYAKIKILLKVKVDRLIAGKTNEPELFRKFLRLPDHVDSIENVSIGLADLSRGYLPRDAERDELEWATAYRSVIRTPVGSLPTYGAMAKGRVSVPKRKARPSYLARNDGVEDLEDEDDGGDEVEGDEGQGTEGVPEAESVERTGAAATTEFAEPEEEDEDEGDDGDDGDDDDDNDGIDGDEGDAGNGGDERDEGDDRDDGDDI